MISKKYTDEENRQEAIELALNVLKAQPNIISTSPNGPGAAKFITDMANAFITYITGKAPGSTT